MSTGDSNDLFARLKQMLPVRWFGTPADAVPLIDSLMSGFAANFSFVYALYAYAKLQTRIATASDGWLDLIAADFFGTALTRKTGQSDASFRNAINAQLLREKATRRAITLALTSLTGRAPTIIEQARPMDVGGYGVPTSGYSTAGYYGSLSLPYQAFVIAYRPLGSVGLANVAGYGIPSAGYSQGSQAVYSTISSLNGGVADADIFNAVDSVKPIASTVWTRISN